MASGWIKIFTKRLVSPDILIKHSAEAVGKADDREHIWMS